MTRVSRAEQEQIETMTRGQSSNDQWRLRRVNRLTASNFGRVVKMRSSTSPHNTVISLLYPDNIDHLPAVVHGKKNEAKALDCLNKILASQKKKVESCGLFIDVDTGYLAASPDGVVDDGETIVEIKCPLKLLDNTVDDLVSTDPTFCLELADKEGGLCELRLKRNHNYYYQIQGQLHCSRREKCLLMVWSPTEHHLETIFYDSQLWSQMSESLESFYLDFMLPEIVDPRGPRGMKIREEE